MCRNDYRYSKKSQEPVGALPLGSAYELPRPTDLNPTEPRPAWDPTQLPEFETGRATRSELQKPTKKSKRRGGVPLPSPSPPRSSWGGHKLWFLFSVYLFEPARTLKAQSAPPSSTFPTRRSLFLPHLFSVPTTHPGHSSRPNLYFPRKLVGLPYPPEAPAFFVYSGSELLFQLEVHTIYR